MHTFHDYLASHLDELLRKRSVVVFYDPRNEFAPFFDLELGRQAGDPLPRVTIAGRSVYLARHSGSFFGLRAAVEPIVAADRPEPLILYLPGVARDRAGSVLMELEWAGACYEPQLRRLALNVLRQQFTDGQIDELLRPASLTYDDIVAYLKGGATARRHRRCTACSAVPRARRCSSPGWPPTPGTRPWWRRTPCRSCSS